MTDVSVLVLPGGGYAQRAEHEGEPVAEWLRRLGLRARVIDYPVGVMHPLPIDHLRREIDRERKISDVVGVLGFSAGGHLAGYACLTGDAAQRPDFGVLCYPVVTMGADAHAGSREILLGSDHAPNLGNELSLENLVTSQAPPLFLWSGADDDAVPVATNSYRLAAALAAAGAPHELHVLERAGQHGVGIDGTAGIISRGLIEAWLRSHGFIAEEAS
jgi:acetyl esterase/lipase